MTKEEAAKDPSRQKASYTGLPVGDHMTLADELAAAGVDVKEIIVEDNSMIMMVLSGSPLLPAGRFPLLPQSHPSGSRYTGSFPPRL